MIGLTIEFIMLKVLNVSGYYRAIKFSESVEYSRLQAPSRRQKLQELSSKEIMKLADRVKKVFCGNGIILNCRVSKVRTQQVQIKIAG